MGAWTGLRAALLLGCGILLGSVAAAKSGKYALHDKVPLVANKVGPFANPTETYPYYSLPFCRPEKLEAAAHALGEYLAGDRKVLTHYDVRYRVNEEWRELCSKALTPEEQRTFMDAIRDEYFFELQLDELPLWGYLGEEAVNDLLLGGVTETGVFYIYTHLHFDVGYNGDRVVTANITTTPQQRVELKPNQGPLNVQFSYSVSWHKSGIEYEQRMARYTSNTFLPTTLEIHWLSIINSIVLVVLLTAFLAVILVRVVHNDLTSYLRGGDEDDELGEAETGWKMLHGDVFRTAPSLNLLSAVVGAGAHLFSMTMCLLIMAVAGMFHHARRGSILTSAIILYSLTAAVGGYTSARLYKAAGGTSWAWNLVTTAAVFPVPLLLAFSFLNTTAVAHSSTAALPFGTIMVVVALWALVAFPLTILGGIAGRNKTDWRPPCRTNKVKRAVPPKPWYRRSGVMMLVAGFLPFSAISIELHYIFGAVWGHKIYTLYGILLLAFALLTIVTACVVVTTTYFQLAAEDWRWPWTSFFSGACVGGFVLAYCVYWYASHSEMKGMLQTAFYGGYSAVFAYAFALITGFVGHIASQRFVRYIYSSLHAD